MTANEFVGMVARMVKPGKDPEDDRATLSRLIYEAKKIMPDEVTVCVEIEGGLIQNVYGNTPGTLIVLDLDIEGSDEVERVNLTECVPRIKNITLNREMVSQDIVSLRNSGWSI